MYIVYASSPATGYLRGGYNFDTTATVRPRATFVRLPLEARSRAVAVASMVLSSAALKSDGYNCNSTSIRLRRQPHYDHSTTYVTTRPLLLYDLNSINRSAWLRLAG